MKNKILWFLSILLVIAVPFCLADNQVNEEAKNKAQQEQNEYYDKLSNCISGKYSPFLTVYGTKNDICKTQLISPIYSEKGVKYQADNCNMPKDIFKSYINDIRVLTPEQYKSKWESVHNKYCKIEYRDNYQ